MLALFFSGDNVALIYLQEPCCYGLWFWNKFVSASFQITDILLFYRELNVSRCVIRLV